MFELSPPPMSNPSIDGIEIDVDPEGRFNLNAIHVASGKTREKSPANWLHRQQSQDFFLKARKQLHDTGIVSTRMGTFAHELVAIEYAGWISQDFRMKVHQAFGRPAGKIQCRQ